jgi:hypothetical protein
MCGINGNFSHNRFPYDELVGYEYRDIARRNNTHYHIKECSE